jgi:hypothetical protein
LDVDDGDTAETDELFDESTGGGQASKRRVVVEAEARRHVDGEKL